MKPLNLKTVSLIGLMFLPYGAQATVYDISNNNDSGDGSFRQQVANSNANGTGNTIDWISGHGGGLITLTTNLDTINGNTILDVSNAAGNVTIVNSYGDVPLGGPVTFSNNNTLITWTMSSVIIGPGSLIKTGSGVLYLNVANTYTGGTIVNAGTLQINSDASLGATTGGLTLDGGKLQIMASGITSARNLTLNAGNGTIDTNSFDLAWTGGIGGPGGLTKLGNGTLTLTGANTYSGGTTVSSGTLLIGSDNALPAAGSVSVTDLGTLDLGTHAESAQNYNNTGITKMVLQPGVTNLKVANNATLGGTLRVSFAPQVLSAGQTFLPITAGTLSGTFADILSPAAIAFDPTYRSDGVLLTTRFIPFADIAATNNQASVGNALEPLRTNPTGDIATVIGNLYTLDTAQLQSALNQIGPLSLASMRNLGVLESESHLEALNKHIGMLSGEADQTLEDSPDTGSQPSRWGTFASGVGAASKGRVISNAPQPSFHSAGFIAGLDYGDEHFVAGFVGGSSDGGSSMRSSTAAGVGFTGVGKLQKQSVRYGLYAASFLDRLRANAYAGIAKDDFSTKRSINFGEIARVAKADTGGDEFSAHANGSYDVFSGGWGAIAPVVGLDYDRFRMGSFTETGADSLDLNVHSQTADSLRSTLNFLYSGQHEVGRLSLGSTISLGWRHEFISQNAVDAQLASGAGNPFSVTAGDFGKDGFLMEIGVAMFWNKRAAFHLDYSGDYFTHLAKYIFNGGIQYKF